MVESEARDISTTVQLKHSPSAWFPTPTKPFDEQVWQSWVENNRASDRRSRARFLQIVKLVSIAGVLAAALLGEAFGPYGVVIRGVVAAGAIVVLREAVAAKQYVLAAFFGALAVLFNPAIPILSSSGVWQRVALLACAVPFAASLAWRTEGKVNHD